MFAGNLDNFFVVVTCTYILYIDISYTDYGLLCEWNDAIRSKQRVFHIHGWVSQAKAR